MPCASHGYAAVQRLVIFVAAWPWAVADYCNITTEDLPNQTVIIKDCPSTIVQITCSLTEPPECREMIFAKTAAVTTSTSLPTNASSSNETTSTSTSGFISNTTSFPLIIDDFNASTDAPLESNNSNASANVTSTTPSFANLTSTTGNVLPESSQTSTAEMLNETSMRTTFTFTTTFTPTTSVTESVSSSFSGTSALATLVVIEGKLSFPAEGVNQSSAEMAVVSMLSAFLGLSSDRITASAMIFSSPGRRLSGFWRTAFQVRVPAEEEEATREKLLGLKNSEEFAGSLRQALVALGSEPAEAFNVALDLPSTEAPESPSDNTIIIVIAAAAVLLLMVGAIIAKACSNSKRDSDGLLPQNKDSNQSLMNANEEGVSSTSARDLEISSLGVAGGADSLNLLGAGSFDERELTEPPLPAPSSPPTQSQDTEVPAQRAAVELTDVEPEVLLRPRQRKEAAPTEWVLADLHLSQQVCQSLSPSYWTGSWHWTEAPELQWKVPVSASKEYSLNFQKGGKIVGHCSDSGTQYKITFGTHREDGELKWREVPQVASAMAFECKGHLRVRQPRGNTGVTGTCYEVVGLFTAVSTSMSARYLGSGRFAIVARTGIEPTSYGNPGYYAADSV